MRLKEGGMEDSGIIDGNNKLRGTGKNEAGAIKFKLKVQCSCLSVILYYTHTHTAMLSFVVSKTATSTRISAGTNARVRLLLGSDAGQRVGQSV